MVFVVAALYKRILLVSVIMEGRDTVDPGFYFIFIIPTFPPVMGGVGSAVAGQTRD